MRIEVDAPAPADDATSSDALPLLALVVPCYNEEEALPGTCVALLAALERLVEERAAAPASFVCFVDDGSRDRTWQIIETANASSPARVCGIRLTRNRGHQNALLAGLFGVDADVVVTLDADLQDDIGAIARMLAAHADGAQIVYGVRENRDADSWFKRASARAFYRLLAASGVETVNDHADYRLMSRRAIDQLRGFGEVNLYLRGLIPLLGLRTATVGYVRGARTAGQTKYPLRKMASLALDAVTSFSVAPLRWVTATGFLIFTGSLAVSAWIAWSRLVSEDALPGWASITLPIFLLGGIQMLGIGILGEYLAKIYLETKERPRYFVEKVVGNPRPRAIAQDRATKECDSGPEGIRPLR